MKSATATGCTGSTPFLCKRQIDHYKERVASTGWPPSVEFLQEIKPTLVSFGKDSRPLLCYWFCAFSTWARFTMARFQLYLSFHSGWHHPKASYLGATFNLQLLQLPRFFSFAILEIWKYQRLRDAGFKAALTLRSVSSKMVFIRTWTFDSHISWTLTKLLDNLTLFTSSLRFRLKYHVVTIGHDINQNIIP